MRIFLILSVLCLAVGVGVIFAYCHGSTNFDFAYPLAGSKLHLDVTTTGVPALAGIFLTLIGSFLLAVVWVIALVRPLGRGVVAVHRDDMKRRDEPFAE